MTEKEKLESYIAMCKSCLLAECMRTCPICLFNIGLAEQVQWKAAETSMPIQVPVVLFAITE